MLALADIRDRVIGFERHYGRDIADCPYQWKIHPKEQLDPLAAFIADIGFAGAILCYHHDGVLTAADGHGRKALQPDFLYPCLMTDLEPEEVKLFIALYDEFAQLRQADEAKLDDLLRDISTDRPELMAMLDELATREGLVPGSGGAADGAGGDDSGPARSTLAECFIVPPFSVLDARQGYWQTRKQAWLSLGIASEVGRGDGYADDDGLTFAISAQGPEIYTIRNQMREASGVDPEWPAVIAEARARGIKLLNGTSIFGPVLCELAYRWFTPPGGAILDPFAGGSVRGIVAAWLGYPYTGIDLRPEQIAANEEQAQAILTPDHPAPRWLVGDSQEVARLAPGAYDMIFSCPPYADLEVYSDDPRDISAMDYPAFLAAYRTIIAESVALLRPDRFACFVVGDVRDKKGFYRNFVSDTIAAFRDAGMQLYNEGVLITRIASLAIRVGRGFGSGRKFGKAHQNVLVFFKGDPKSVTSWGPVEVGDVESMFGEPVTEAA